ncbi:hypothetical protein ACH4SP_03370 [Streptomyces sp. NPDC021093]|uniref:hypothetical protein n=1 Tax=Streptomyces sp. NPDC021093 TaxID=3365112 RepID=UPI00379B169F
MKSSLLSMRAALVLLLAVLAGAGAGALSLLAGRSLAESVLIGAGAAGLAVTFFDRLIAADSAPGSTSGSTSESNAGSNAGSAPGNAVPPNSQGPAAAAGDGNG